MTDNFYHAFEGRYRGSRELIKSRQMAYLPYIEALKKEGASSAPLKALDLGCGRGEWLELLGEWGVDAQGIDLDAAMLSICYEKGLNVSQQNALEVLANMPDKSLDIVSGFHLAEHLEFADLINLVQQSFRALKSGGLLILETPNAENIAVATSTFYLDPTHNNPLPMQLLGFLYEYAGFADVKEVRLNADITLGKDRWISLHDVVTGVSRDYAIVGQKALEIGNSTRGSIGTLVRKEGITYIDLVSRFDIQTDRVNQQIGSLITESAALKASIEDLKIRVHRLEFPLRIAKKILRIPLGVFRRIKRIVKSVLIWFAKKLGIYAGLYAFIHRHRDRIDYDALSPHAKEVYRDLKGTQSGNAEEK